MDAFSTEGDVNAGGIWATLYSIQYLASDLSALSRNVGNLCGILSGEDSGVDIDQLVNDISELSKLCQNAVDNVYSHSEDYHSIIENSKEITQIISMPPIKPTKLLMPLMPLLKQPINTKPMFNPL